MRADAETLDQTVEQRLRLAVDPMQILENQEQWLLACLPQQKVPHGIQHAPATLSRSRASASGASLDRRRRAGPATPAASARAPRSSASSLPVTLSPIALKAVLLVDLEVALEKIDNRQIAHRLAVRDRGAFEHQPPLQAGASGRVRRRGATCPPRPRQPAPRPDRDRHRRAAAPGEAVPARRRGRRSASARDGRRPGAGSAPGQRLSVRGLPADRRAL